MRQGWKICTVGDVCEKGSSNVSQNQLANEIGDYAIFGASGLIKNISFYHQDKPYLSIVKDGSGVGRITKMDAYTSVIGTLQYILPKENVDLSYLYYSLISIDFKKYVEGAAIPHIYFKDYKNEPFLWTPLPEQERIVGILDKAFEEIKRAKEIAEQNLKNAKELFASTLNSIDYPKESLSNYVEIVTGKLNSNASIDNGKYPFFTCSRQIYKIDTYAFDCEAILLAGNNASGDFNVKHFEGKFNAYQRTYIITIKNKQKLLYRYLYFQLTNSLAEFKNMSKGANTKFLKLGMIHNFEIPCPPLAEQQLIVAKLDALSEQTKKLEAIYSQKLADLEELKKSILQKAFNGEL